MTALQTSSPMVDDDALQSLRTVLRGTVLLRGEEGYDTARQVYNRMIDKHPAVIARCVDVADVIAAVNFARNHGLTLAVRGGGHNGGGLGICDDGLVVDLSGLKGIHVDPDARTARVAGGCTWGEVDHATHAFGLATPSGIISTTGVGGLTLGGGLGHLTRACGLSIDNVLSVDVVLADGRIVTANKDEHPDLFWAVRGGGGNFGVVTSFLFKLHPISTVYGGPMLWELDQCRPTSCAGIATSLSRPRTQLMASSPSSKCRPARPSPSICTPRRCAASSGAIPGRWIRPTRFLRPSAAVGAVALDLVGPLPHPALQSMFDALYPPGFQWYWRADFVNELSDEAIALHIKHGSTLPTLFSTMHLYPINGAAGRVGKNDTAWSYRSATWGEVIVGVDPDPARADELKDWTIAYWEALHPYSAGGAYVNMMMDEGQERVKAAYRDNYDRLVAVKNKYDPTNLFHVNQNIKPTGH